MPLKNFKTRNGIDVDTYTIPNTVIQATIKTNSATTLDTVAMASFNSIEYLVTITQGSKIRTSKVVMHTDGTNVDMTEYGITETGGIISGVAISATTSSTNAVLQGTITDAATTLARVKMSRNINVIFTPVAPDAPTVGTATGGAGSASITFTAPYDNGGATITSYRATSSPGSITGNASSSPVTVSGLTGGTAYTFTIAAINSAGISTASSASNSVTPTAVPVEAGYIAGGSTTLNGSGTNNIQKLQFSNESNSSVSATLSAAEANVGGFANSGTAGYVGGGSGSTGGGGYTPAINKILFAGDTVSTLVSTLSNQGPTGFANSGTAGYFAGGAEGSSTVSQTAAVHKLPFSTDSLSALGNLLSAVKGTPPPMGFANSGTAGYVVGGGGSSGTTDKIAFSNDSRSSLGSVVGAGQAGAGFANSGTAGYASAGFNGSSSIRKILFSNDTGSTLSSTLGLSLNYTAGFAKSGTAGYVVGGLDTATSTAIQKLLFSNETTSTISATLTSARYTHAGFANSGTL